MLLDFPGCFVSTLGLVSDNTRALLQDLGPLATGILPGRFQLKVIEKCFQQRLLLPESGEHCAAPATQQGHRALWEG